MEREKEITKLINVLRRTSRMALQSEWTGGGQDAASFCVEQYNRVLARLREIDPDVGAVFAPLAESSSLTVAAMACRQLASYYEDEVETERGWGKAYSFNVGAQPFKDFWQKSAREIEDLGEFIRESIDEWTRQKRHRPRHGEGCASEETPGEKAPGEKAAGEEAKDTKVQGDPDTRPL
ncbi:MAG TPA: hypothetical protein VNH22_19835 [Blastocatellia bacterium]|jgi:hypothetical protein|nr:hypothetical protein [Blastocatellia bacterium]